MSERDCIYSFPPVSGLNSPWIIWVSYLAKWVLQTTFTLCGSDLTLVSLLLYCCRLLDGNMEGGRSEKRNSLREMEEGKSDTRWNSLRMMEGGRSERRKSLRQMEGGGCERCNSLRTMEGGVILDRIAWERWKEGGMRDGTAWGGTWLRLRILSLMHQGMRWDPHSDLEWFIFINRFCWHVGHGWGEFHPPPPARNETTPEQYRGTCYMWLCRLSPINLTPLLSLSLTQSNLKNCVFALQYMLILPLFVHLVPQKLPWG